MQYGTVVEFFPEKGFGFIQRQRGADVFFHVTVIGACQETPEIEVGQAVKFELAPVRRSAEERSSEGHSVSRPKAMLVELIDRIPGAVAQRTDRPQAMRHPRARQRKPTWRQ